MATIYGIGAARTEALKRRGFGFTPSTNPHYCYKTSQPFEQVVIETVAELLHLIRELGSITVTADGLLIVADDYQITPSNPVKLDRVILPEQMHQASGFVRP